MKKIILIIVLLIFINGCSGQSQTSVEEKSPEMITEEIEPQPPIAPEEIEEAEILCPDYDSNEEECLLHEECKWDSEINECNSVNMSEKEDGKLREDDEESEFASELEKGLPNTIQNEICKKLPLTKELSPGDRHYCFAIVNNNAEFCNKIDEEDQANLCLAHAKQDVSYCKNMNSALGKRTCYFGLSLISGNIDICDGINWDKDLKQLCHFSFVNTLYWEDKSDQITLAHCNKLPEPDRSTCLAYKEVDVSLCKNNVNCLTFFEQPMSFCTGKGSILESCIRDRAMTNKDLSICKTLTGEKRDDCISDFAGHISQDISTCDMISEVRLRQTCYKDVAVQSGWLKG